MSAGRPGRPCVGVVCGIFQQKHRTYRTTDSDSMPALATLSALSTALTGLVQIAGQMVDLLDSAKSISLVPSRNGRTKSDKSQGVDTSQLACVFAAYLASAAHPTTGPTGISKPSAQATPAPISTSKPSAHVSAPRTALETSNKSAYGSPSVAPLTVVLAAGPTTAITMAMALSSVPATVHALASGGTRTTAVTHKVALAAAQTVARATPSPSTTTIGPVPHPPVPVPAAAAAFRFPAIASTVAVTPHAAAIATSVAIAPHSPTAVPTGTVASHPPTAQAAAAVVIAPTSPKGVEVSRTTSASATKLQDALHSAVASAKPVRPAAPIHVATPATAPHLATKRPPSAVATLSVPDKTTQSVSNASSSQRTASASAEKPPASGTYQNSIEQTPTEMPVLALHDVPILSLSDSPQPNGNTSVLRPPRTETQETNSSSIREVSSHQAWERSEVLRFPEGPAGVAAAQTKYLGWAESSRPTTPLPASLRDPIGPTIREGTQLQSPAVQATSPLAAIAPMTAPGTVNTPVANNTPAAPSDAQPNVSPAEQLSRAFVAQAALGNHEGRSDFHLRLQPPQLGSVQIHLTATQHTISARVIVTQEGTQQLIQSQADQLRQSLAESGLVLGSFDVTRDGGGSSQGGRHQPPELSQPPLLRPGSPTATAVGRTSRIVAADGVDILA